MTTNQTPLKPRTVKLRISVNDPDGKTMNAKYELPETALIAANDPASLLFSALQEMSHKLVSEAFNLASPAPTTESKEN